MSCAGYVPRLMPPARKSGASILPRRRPGRADRHRTAHPLPGPGRAPRPGPGRAAARDAQAAPLLAQDQETVAAPVTSAPAPADPASPWFPVDPDSDTQPIAAVSAPIGGRVTPAGIKPVSSPNGARPDSPLPKTRGLDPPPPPCGRVITTVLVLLGSGSWRSRCPGTRPAGPRETPAGSPRPGRPPWPRRPPGSPVRSA